MAAQKDQEEHIKRRKCTQSNEYSCSIIVEGVLSMDWSHLKYCKRWQINSKKAVSLVIPATRTSEVACNYNIVC